MGTVFGYVRVSTKEQNEDRQMLAMREFGVPEGNILIDKQSGKNFLRPAYSRLIYMLQPSDIVVVKSIDRLGRNYNEIIQQWRVITKEKNADMVVIDMPLLDTRTNEQGITGVFVADLVLQILSYVAHTERENIHQRQKEGIAAAKLRGIRFGRPRMDLPEGFDDMLKQWKRGEISATKAGDALGISYKTFLRRARELEA